MRTNGRPGGAPASIAWELSVETAAGEHTLGRSSHRAAVDRCKNETVSAIVWV